MMWSRRLLFGIVCLLAIGIDGFDRHRVAAAGAAAPTVAIRRNPVFVGPVRTGDFNGDGFADLVGSTADPANPSGPAVVTVGLSRADGSLGTLVRTHVPGTILAVGDLNADGKLDVLVRTVVSNGGQAHSELSALRGNGDGTFAASPSVVMSVSYVFFALIADFDGDGHLDIGAAVDRDGDDNIAIQQGHGDFTFTFVRDLGGGGDTPFAGAVADLNGDGKADIVTANGEFNSLSLYLNQGALQFTSSQMTLAHVANDVAAADLNGDGRVDLVIAASDNPHPAYHEGYATVLRGVGGGAFAAPVDYPTAPGAYHVVLGDFNRDGITDIATANRSEIYYDALCDPRQTWDSISIFPGMTAGIGARSDFSIGNQLKSDDTTTDRNKVESLASADVNGDHVADLVTSNGTIFLNRPADPNWAPTVDAGPDQVVNDPGDHFVHLYSRASDVDQDMLTYAWFDSGGDSIPPVPSPCFSPHTLGVHTYTVVVDDGHGHTASDSMTVDFGADNQPPALSVTAPAAGEVVPATHPYVIRWSVTPGTEPIQRFDLMFSPDDGFTTSFIAECTNLAGSATSCQWNNPPVTERGRIQVLAQNANGTTTAAAKSGLFAVRTTTTSGLPGGWSHADIGSVGTAGNATSSQPGSFTVTGAGSDIWGTADRFHYAWTMMSGDFEVNALVDSIQNVNAWTKAGVMIRETSAAGSRHVSLFASAGKGLAFQRRPSTGGDSVSTAGPLLTAPVWVRLTRRGTLIPPTTARRSGIRGRRSAISRSPTSIRT